MPKSKSKISTSNSAPKETAPSRIGVQKKVDKWAIKPATKPSGRVASKASSRRQDPVQVPVLTKEAYLAARAPRKKTLLPPKPLPGNHIATFVSSSKTTEGCPTPVIPEYAFIGRSNVGKSSLINMLAQMKGLAKTSSTPGKTQLLNHFIFFKSWYLADLPGYGYAKISHKSRLAWEGMNKHYLQHRPNLMCTFVLIDSRLEPQEPDLDFIKWMANKQLPIALVFTKGDKLGKTKVEAAVVAYKNHLLQEWNSLPPIFITSAEDSWGRDQLLQYIDATNAIFTAPDILP